MKKIVNLYPSPFCRLNRVITITYQKIYFKHNNILYFWNFLSTILNKLTDVALYLTTKTGKVQTKKGKTIVKLPFLLNIMFL